MKIIVNCTFKLHRHIVCLYSNLFILSRYNYNTRTYEKKSCHLLQKCLRKLNEYSIDAKLCCTNAFFLLLFRNDVNMSYIIEWIIENMLQNFFTMKIYAQCQALAYVLDQHTK